MTPPARSLPQATESVCPVCLRRIPAEYVLDPAEEGIPSVLLRKECPRIPAIRSWSGSAVVLSTAGCARIMPSIPVRG